LSGRVNFAIMLTQSLFAAHITAEQYDEFLANGWFRDSSMLYRSDLVVLDAEVLEVVHVRIPLDHFSYRKGQRTLMRKIENRFNVIVREPLLTDAHNQLYQAQMHRFRGFVHSGIQDFLFRSEDDPIELMEVAVYDRDRLIAVSFFDLGAKCIASLIGLYDPAYSSFSLGYYTMLKEMEWARSAGMTHYYPGYVFDLPTDFDYKLRTGIPETLIPGVGWRDGLHRPVSEESAGVRVRRKINELGQLLAARNVAVTRKYYPHFTAAQLMNLENTLFVSPVYYEIIDGATTYAACYDPSTDAFVLRHIEPSKGLHGLISMPLSKEYQNSVYETRLMRVVSSVPIFPQNGLN